MEKLFKAAIIAAFDIQLFATQTTLLNSSGNDLSPEMKTYYSDFLIDMAGPKLVHDQFGEKKPIPKNGGKTIEFRKFSPLPKATTPITEGVTPTGNKLDVTALTAAVKQYGDFITTSDVIQLTAIDNVVVESTKLLGQQAGKTLDTITRDILNAGTNVMYAPSVTAAKTTVSAEGVTTVIPGTETEVTSRADLTMNAKLTVDVILRAVATLKAMDAEPIGSDFVAIVHPYVAYDLMRDPEWIAVKSYSDPEDLYEGEIGKIGGVRFVQSTEAKIWKDTTCPANGSGKYAVFSTLVIGANAYGVTEVEGGGLQHIVKPLGYGDDPLNQRASVGWKAIKTAEILVQPYMVRIESLSKYSGIAEAN